MESYDIRDMTDKGSTLLSIVVIRCNPPTWIALSSTMILQDSS